MDNTLQDMQPHHKWTDCSRVGVYIGDPPVQSKIVVLVISLKNELVRPQFHVNFDSQFQTVGQEDLPLKC